MEEKGWLTRDSPRSGVWKPGLLTRAMFSEEELSPKEERELDELLKPVAEQADLSVEELRAELPGDLSKGN